MLGPNQVLVTCRGMMDAPLVTKMSAGVLKYIQISTGSVKTNKLYVSWKMLEIEFEFLRLVKSFVFNYLPLRENCPETELFLVYVQSKYTKIRTRKKLLCVTHKVNRYLSKKTNMKKKKKKKI